MSHHVSAGIESESSEKQPTVLAAEPRSLFLIKIWSNFYESEPLLSTEVQSGKRYFLLLKSWCNKFLGY